MISSLEWIKGHGLGNKPHLFALQCHGVNAAAEKFLEASNDALTADLFEELVTSKPGAVLLLTDFRRCIVVDLVFEPTKHVQFKVKENPSFELGPLSSSVTLELSLLLEQC